jgi:hypothetical protein
MTDAERIEALKRYLRHFGECALMVRGGACDCGLYRLLGFSLGEKGAKNGSATGT